jgi:Ca2+-binding EF-hand superfamily protein
MTILSALSRKQTLGFLTLALVLAGGIALAAPAASNPPSKPDASTDPHPGRGHGGPGHRGPGHRGPDPFARWDKDNDGKITLKDLPERAQNHLTTIDANKDGILTREEFEKGREQLRAAREKEFDTNKDGKVTADERKAGMKAHMEKMFAERFTEDDKNHDGFLVQSEVPRRWEHLKVADANNDSKVSLAELKTAFESGKMGPPKGHGRGRGHGHERGASDDARK